jgi:hypothetical protein
MKLTSMLLASTMITAAFSLGSVTVPVAAHASTVGGPITRAEVLARAQFWVDRGDIYSPNAPDSYSYASGPDGGSYRQDCSGLVSMAWHLRNNPVTGDFENGAGPSHEIAKSDLKPGDAIVRPGHIELFASWGTSGGRHGAFVYSFNSRNETVQNPSHPSNFGNLGFNSDSDMDSYTAIRYNNIVDGTASFSGDSRADMVLMGDAFRIWPNTNGQNQGWPWGSEYSAGSGWSGVDPAAVYFADMDGDGKTELIQKYGDGFRVWPNTNGQTAGAFPWGTPFTTGSGWTTVDPSDVYFADITGDGKADIVQRTGDALRYFPNVNGAGFGTPIAAGSGWTGVNPRALHFA